MYDKLQQLGTLHIVGLDQADKEQVFKCIRDRMGRFLTQDDHVLYVETEEEIEKPRYGLTGEAKEVLKDYYNAIHTLLVAQTNFTKSTQVLEEKIEDKSVFLSIIQQVQLPAVKIQVRTVEEVEQLEGKTYQELTLPDHLPNFTAIDPNATEQMRTMAAYMYFVLYEQITSLKASQTGCATDFRCQGTRFKRLVTGKRQPSRPGRLSKAKGGSSRTLEEVAKMEGATLPSRERGHPEQQQQPSQQHQQNLAKVEAKEAEGKESRRLSKILKQAGRTVRLEVRVQDFKRADDSLLYIVFYLRKFLLLGS